MAIRMAIVSPALLALAILRNHGVYWSVGGPPLDSCTTMAIRMAIVPPALPALSILRNHGDYWSVGGPPPDSCTTISAPLAASGVGSKAFLEDV